MNERQLTVSAIALFADGFSHTQIADALGVDTDRAAELTATGADEQSTGTMGHMKNCPSGEDQVVSSRDDEGQVTGSVERL